MTCPLTTLSHTQAIDRRERLRKLALETIDLAKDPYFMRNHLGSYECRLCLTLHNNEGNYLAHTQGKRHQQNLAKRAAREAQDAPAQPQPNQRKITAVKRTVKIGRPGCVFRASPAPPPPSLSRAPRMPSRPRTALTLRVYVARPVIQRLSPGVGERAPPYR